MATGNGEAIHVASREYAVSLDEQDAFRHHRDEFHIPSRAQLKAKSLPEAGEYHNPLFMYTS